MEPHIIETTGARAAIIWLHGLGADGYDFSPIVPALTLTYPVRFVFPHAPIQPVTLNGGAPCRSWFDIYSLSHLEEEDTDGMNQTERYVHTLIQQQIDLGIPSHRIILVGFSQGGAVALYAGLRYPKRLGGMVGLSTWLPQHITLENSRSEMNQRTPIFLAHGDSDSILPIGLAVQSREQLKQWGYSVYWHHYAMAHQVCAEEIRDLSVYFNSIDCEAGPA